MCLRASSGSTPARRITSFARSRIERSGSVCATAAKKIMHFRVGSLISLYSWTILRRVGASDVRYFASIGSISFLQFGPSIRSGFRYTQSIRESVLIEQESFFCCFFEKGHIDSSKYYAFVIINITHYLLCYQYGFVFWSEFYAQFSEFSNDCDIGIMHFMKDRAICVDCLSQLRVRNTRLTTDGQETAQSFSSPWLSLR